MGMAENEKVAVSIERFQEQIPVILAELQKIMVGQEGLIHDLLVALLAGGNVLLEGVPGLGKTLLVRTLSQVLDCSFNRIQFTPDLMPADITGTVIITETAEGRRGFRFERGPVFANLLLADEINRAAPRTQSALLEAMQEQRVTVAGQTYPLPQPFFVLATQNPIEMEDTYPLPEAQVDRFLYKILVSYPSETELVEIARRTTRDNHVSIHKIASGGELLGMQELASQVPVEDRVYLYAARLVKATHPAPDGAKTTVVDAVRRNLRVGVSPRGIQSLIRAAKVEALLDRRKAVAIDDVRKVAYPALRHRLILNYEAQAEGIQADTILQEVVRGLAVP
jgi:MoxR-like ATPase